VVAADVMVMPRSCKHKQFMFVALGVYQVHAEAWYWELPYAVQLLRAVWLATQPKYALLVTCNRQFVDAYAPAPIDAIAFILKRVS
jgi:hypothetical protein